MSADATAGRGESAPRRPVVTVAALYGAGGSIVGPRVAERLGVPLLDREIPGDVARRTGLPEEAAAKSTRSRAAAWSGSSGPWGWRRPSPAAPRGQMSGWISRSAG